MLKDAPSVLVIEDEDTIRSLIVEVLREAGFDVSSADSGWQALDMVDGRRFDLLVADVALPGGLDGYELVQCARSRAPSIKCLFISGKRPPAVEDPDRDEFVSKPFRDRELLGCVWELLQRRVSPPARDWHKRQAERTLIAAEVDCRRNQRRQQEPARRGDRLRRC